MEQFFFYYIWLILCIIFLLVIRFNVYKIEFVYNSESNKYDRQKGERYRLPLILYILGFVATFVPILNIIFSISSFIILCVESSEDEITFSGWLFKEI